MKREYDKNNVFAKIIRKELPADIIFEDEFILSFHDIAKKADIHALVIPKSECTDFNHFIQISSEVDIAYFFQSLTKIAGVLGLHSGYKTIFNTGASAGQEVMHFHCHILGGRMLTEIRI